MKKVWKKISPGLLFNRKATRKLETNNTITSPLYIYTCVWTLVYKQTSQYYVLFSLATTIVISFTLFHCFFQSRFYFYFTAIYLIVILAFGIVSVFVTIFVLYCHNTAGDDPIPGWLQKIASHVLIPFSCNKKGSCCTLNCCNRKRKINNQNKDEDLQHPDIKKWVESEISWKQLGRMVDSFSFNASLLVNFVMGSLTYLFLIYGYIKT